MRENQLAERYICIHGHFYQPPRENPWLEEVEFQDSAQPYHDWNERVTAECYAPNAVSRVMDSEWRIIGLINNYSRISFNFGPTLLYWLDRHKPKVYESILNADKESMNNFSGHGSAIAQVYNHMIMPLADRRDKETQVKWAIYDFQVRFGRVPEGMWLPETAVDTETLEVLAENNIKFTILSPIQASKTRRIGEQNWVDVSNSKIDPRRSYQCNLPSGKKITLFFFDKRTASDIAFGNLLENGEAFAKRLVDAFNDENQAVLLESVASDGELYGHHHPHGDMTLAYCIYHIVSKDPANLTNYAAFLEKHPPQYEVQIVENTSWSCMHGVERWKSDCGDHMGHEGWNQKWRKPLREAMDWLRDELVPRFESDAALYLKDPWGARNDFISVILDRSRENIEAFLLDHAIKPLEEAEKRRVIKLLEMQRHVMLMYTSCGWFFDEISGIETVQVMMYAARAMQLAKQLFDIDLESQYISNLEQAPSNIAEFQNGAKVYKIFIKPSVVDFTKISAQNTIRELFADNIKTASLSPRMPNCCFKITPEISEKWDDGKFRFIVNRSTISSSTTLDEQVFSSVAIWLGDHNVTCGARSDMHKKTFKWMRNELVGYFDKGQINEIIVGLSKYFGKHNYSLKDLFKDDQRYILEYIVTDGLKKAKDLFDVVYHDNSAMLRFMKENRIPSPKPLQSAAEIVLNMDLERLLSAEKTDLEKLGKIINDSKHLSVALDSSLLGFLASEKIADEFNKLSQEPENLQKVNAITELIHMVRELPIELNLWESQNIAFKIAQSHYQSLNSKDDEASKLWVASFVKLCELIGIRLA
jgi:alpha-amylase/alpha-mannosidase (GH57 family)